MDLANNLRNAYIAFFILTICSFLLTYNYYSMYEHNKSLVGRSIEHQKELCYELKKMCEKYEPEKLWRYQ